MWPAICTWPADSGQGVGSSPWGAALNAALTTAVTGLGEAELKGTTLKELSLQPPFPSEIKV